MCLFGTPMILDVSVTLGILAFLWLWVLTVPPYVRRIRSLHPTGASGLALPGLILLTDRGFTRRALRHEYEHIRQMRRYSPLGVILALAWHYGTGYLVSIVRHGRWPDFWQLWLNIPLEKQANSAAQEHGPLPFMFGEIPGE